LAVLIIPAKPKSYSFPPVLSIAFTVKVEKKNLRSGELLKAHWQLEGRRLTHTDASQSVELEHV